MQFNTLHSPPLFLTYTYTSSTLWSSLHSLMLIRWCRWMMSCSRMWRSDNKYPCGWLSISWILIVFGCPDAVCWHSGWIMMMRGLISYHEKVDCSMKSNAIDQNWIAYCINESAILNTTVHWWRHGPTDNNGCIMSSVIARKWRL